MRTTVVMLVAALVWCVSGCGKKNGNVDTGPYVAAFKAYLKEKRMGVEFTSISDLKVTGDEATAVVRVTEKGSTGLQPKWKVTWRRAGENWTVASAQR